MSDKKIELTLADDEDAAERGKPRLPAGAYNPYDVDPRRPKKTATTAATRTDLRKLSQWIKLKREVDELKAEDTSPEPEAAPIAAPAPSGRGKPRK